MAFEIASRSGTCSTLVWAVWSPQYHLYPDKDRLKAIVLGLRADIKESENPLTKGIIPYSSYSADKKGDALQVLDGHKVEKFAWIIGTIGGGSTWIEALKAFGFNIADDFVHNAKNETDVALFQMQVCDMLARLEEFDEDGFLKSEKVKDAKAA